MLPPSTRPAVARRPFTRATADLPRAESGPPRHGTDVLPELLAFGGAVHLAQTLDSKPTPLEGAPLTGAVDIARRRLGAAERDAYAPLSESSGEPLVSRERFARVLARTGAPATRARKPLANAARELFGPIEARTLQRVAAIRRDITHVRRDLGPTILTRGPSAARLEQLDAALAQATAARCENLVARAVAAVGESFAAALERLVVELPRDAPELPLEEWLGPDGFVAAHVARCEELCVATFVHERARVDMLVRHTLHERLV